MFKIDHIDHQSSTPILPIGYCIISRKYTSYIPFLFY